MLRPCTIVTGARGHIGKIIVEDLLRSGHAVVGLCRQGSEVRDPLPAEGQQNLHTISIDLLQPEANAIVLAELDKRRLCVTGLVNAARSLETLSVDDAGFSNESDFMEELRLQVVVPYQLTICLWRNAAHSLRSVVNIGSQYGISVPNPALYDGTLVQSPVQYGVSKAAVHQLTKELAVRLAPRTRVNCVAFGGFEGRVDETFKLKFGKMLPSGRMLRLQEAAGPVRFLLSDDSSSLTGHVLIADGGWTLW